MLSQGFTVILGYRQDYDVGKRCGVLLSLVCIVVAHPILLFKLSITRIKIIIVEPEYTQVGQ